MCELTHIFFMQYDMNIQQTPYRTVHVEALDIEWETYKMVQSTQKERVGAIIIVGKQNARMLPHDPWT